MSAITSTDEFPVAEIPATAFWSENYCFVGFDPVVRIGFWMHIGRWSKNNRLWREQPLLFLPDGSFALLRGFGLRPSGRGPCGALMNVTCEDPGVRWRLQYLGPTRRTTRTELARGPLMDAPLELLEFDLEFVASSEIWDFAGDQDMARESWASSHYEQTGRWRGTVRYGGRTIEIDALGHRDHSRGVRSYGPMANSVWMQGHFPGGRSFALVHCEMREGPPTVHAAVFEGGKVYAARNLQLPAMRSIEDQPTAYQMRLESDLGVMEIDARFAQVLPLSLDDHHECFYGATLIPGVSKLMAIIGPTSLTWGGREGVGHTELAYGV